MNSLFLHTDVSERACTSCRPQANRRVWSLSCWILLLSTVSYRKYLFQVS